MNDDQPQAFDPEVFKQELSQDLEKRAEQIAEQKLQERLGKLAGDSERSGWGFTAKDSQGRPAPRSWDEGAEAIASRAKQEALSEFEKKLEQREKQKEQLTKKQREQQLKENQRQFSQWDSDWQALVEEGDMPAMSEETQKKLKAGVLSDDEALKDPALKARYDLLQSAMDYKRRTGKDVNLYRFYKTDYQKQAGMDAPVTGSSRGVTPSEDLPSRDEIRRMRLEAQRARR